MRTSLAPTHSPFTKATHVVLGIKRTETTIADGLSVAMTAIPC